MIVRFPDEDGNVDVVPVIWLINDYMCLYPQNRSQFRAKMCQKPDGPLYKSYKVEVVGRASK